MFHSRVAIYETVAKSAEAKHVQDTDTTRQLTGTLYRQYHQNFYMMVRWRRVWPLSTG